MRQTAAAHHLIERIFDQLFDGDRLIDDAIDEGGIGAIFQQAAYQIGQQGFMCPDRRINAAGLAQAARRQRADHVVVERLAHAVQALELVVLDPARLGQRMHAGQGMGIVRGELRIHRIGCRQQALGADQIGQIGMCLAGVNRVVSQPIDLGALDFAVPVGALDQTDHEAPAMLAGQGDQPVDHGRTALLVGLHDKAHAVPAGQLGIGCQGGKKVERQFQPIRLLGVDIDPDVVAAGQLHQVFQARQQLRHDAFALRPDIARMQRRELDRDARPGLHATAVRRLADGVNGRAVGLTVALGIGSGERGLAQHVEGVAITARLVVQAARQRRVDILAHDKLLAEEAHGEIDAFADQRLTAPRQHLAQGRAERTVRMRGHQLAGQHQPPGRGIHEQRGTAAQVRFPVAMADFVANQTVDRRAVRNPQQGFGEAHQGDAFLAGQGELVHQVIDAARCAALAAHRFDQAIGLLAHPATIRRHTSPGFGQRLQTGRFVSPVMRTNPASQDVHAQPLSCKWARPIADDSLTASMTG